MFRNLSSLLLHYHHTIISSYVIIQRCTIHHRKYLYLCRSDLIEWSTISPVSCQNPPDRFFNQSQDLSWWTNEIHPNILSHWHQKLTVNDPSRAGSNVGKTDEKTEYQFFHVKCFVHSSDIASEHDPSLDKTEVENSTSFFCSLQDSVFSYDIWGNHFTPPFLKTKPQRVWVCQNKQSRYYIIVKYYLLNGLSVNHPTFLFKCSGVWIAALLIVSFIDPN